ncbi:Protein cappuccino [Halotydeus destructor]|nr:Protein cappuccino [Halotydeus destructor]
MPPPGPMAFPGPPVGGWSAVYQAARKKPISPKANMKPLYWTRIQVPMTITQVSPEEDPISDSTDGGSESRPVGCLWEHIDEDEVVKESIVQQFAELFSRQPVKKKAPVVKPEKAGGLKAKQKLAHLLDDKRAHNLNIFITSLHLDISDIENAVYNLDTSSLSTETLMKINDLKATDDELKKIKGHLDQNGDVQLARPEQFLFELSNIESFSERVACIMFEIQFVESITIIETRLDNFKLTCDTLMTSKGIASVFSIILTLGNYMNGGNRERGQADGFGLEILPKLKDVRGKTDSRTPTLLHYIVNVYIDKVAKEEEISNFLDVNIALPLPEPQDLERASIVDFDEIEKELAKLKQQIEIADRRVQKVLDAIKVKGLNGSSPETEAKPAVDENSETTPDTSEASPESSEVSPETSEASAVSPSKEKADTHETNHAEPFKSRMEAFIKKATKLLADQEENLSESRGKFPVTTDFFKYRVKAYTDKERVKEFFDHWIPFCSDFKDFFKKELLLRKKDAMLEAKKKLKEREEAKKKNDKKNVTSISGSGLKNMLKRKGKLS